MNQKIVFTFFTLLQLLISPVFAQNTDENVKEIINLVFSNNFELFGSNKYFLECSKPKTYFNISNFLESTNLEVPQSIIVELENESMMQKKESVWDEKYFKDIIINNTYSGKIQPKCIEISKDDIIRSRKNNNHKIKGISFLKGKESPIFITFSNPIFDSERKHCVISVTQSLYTHSFTAKEYFLVKIYGKWIIVHINWIL